MKDFLNLPPDWSAHGAPIDNLIALIHWVMLALFIGWGAYYILVLVKFRAGASPKADYHGAKGTVSKYVEVAVVVDLDA